MSKILGFAREADMAEMCGDIGVAPDSKKVLVNVGGTQVPVIIMERITPLTFKEDMPRKMYNLMEKMTRYGLGYVDFKPSNFGCLFSI